MGSARLKSFKIYRYPNSNYAHLVQHYIYNLENPDVVGLVRPVGMLHCRSKTDCIALCSWSCCGRYAGGWCGWKIITGVQFASHELVRIIIWCLWHLTWTTLLTTASCWSVFVIEEGCFQTLPPAPRNIQNWKYMGVYKNRGTPKWMVKMLENPIKLDDLGVPLFLKGQGICIICFLKSSSVFVDNDPPQCLLPAATHCHLRMLRQLV